MKKRELTGTSGDSKAVAADLVQMTRLAITAGEGDVRLFAARLVRRYRNTEPQLAEQLKESLQSRPSRTQSPFREEAPAPEPTPSEQDGVLSLLRSPTVAVSREPLLARSVKHALLQVVQERKQMERLTSLGLDPTRSAIFVGPPGVGKTLSAAWLAGELEVPLRVLDLSAVMSSYLGRTGSNLRKVLDFARLEPCVLLLDEIDALAKRRGDDFDVGELKRVVAVILQEIDSWPSTSLLLATTNHAELIDPALWRRFDLVVDFPVPDKELIEAAVPVFLGPDAVRLASWVDFLALVLRGMSFSDVEKEVQRLRRSLALGQGSERELVEAVARRRASALDHGSRIELAEQLAMLSGLSQHAISDLTGVSRDTIRKRVRNGGVAGAATRGART